MKATVDYCQVHADELASAVAAAWPFLGLDDTEPASAWLDAPNTPNGIELRDADLRLKDAQRLAPMWPEGRLFGAHGELRWERLPNDAYHLVLLTEAGAVLPPGYPEDTRLDLVQDDHDEHVLLWGERSSGKWAEERIPHLEYHAAWKKRYARLTVRHYRAEPTDERPYERLFARYVRFTTHERPTLEAE